MLAAEGRAGAWDSLGRRFLRWRKPKWAVHCCRRATALASGNMRHWRRRAAAAMRSGDLAEAALCYRALVRLEPEGPRPYARLAQVYEQMGARRAALEVCCQGLRHHPEARVLHRCLAGLLLASDSAPAVVASLMGLPDRPTRGPDPVWGRWSAVPPGSMAEPASQTVLWHADADAYLEWALAAGGPARSAAAEPEAAPSKRLTPD
jgi:tetratricopeptide (TPR) repeat protein